MKVNKILVGFILIALVLCTYFLLRSKPSEEEALEFESSRWLEGDRRLRGMMVDDLMRDSLLNGLTKIEVINLLGEPTASDTTATFIYAVDIGKEVGPYGLGGIWLFFLTIEFDQVKNNVIGVRCTD